MTERFLADLISFWQSCFATEDLQRQDQPLESQREPSVYRPIGRARQLGLPTLCLYPTANSITTDRLPASLHAEMEQGPPLQVFSDPLNFRERRFLVSLGLNARTLLAGMLLDLGPSDHLPEHPIAADHWNPPAEFVWQNISLQAISKSAGGELSTVDRDFTSRLSPNISSDSADSDRQAIEDYCLVNLIREPATVPYAIHDQGRSVGHCLVQRTPAALPIPAADPSSDAVRRPARPESWLGLHDLFINPEFRSQGIATEVLQTIRQLGKQQGCTQVAVLASPTRQNFYQQRGFRKVARLETWAAS